MILVNLYEELGLRFIFVLLNGKNIVNKLI